VKYVYAHDTRDDPLTPTTGHAFTSSTVPSQHVTAAAAPWFVFSSVVVLVVVRSGCVGAGRPGRRRAVREAGDGGPAQPAPRQDALRTSLPPEPSKPSGVPPIHPQLGFFLARARQSLNVLAKAGYLHALDSGSRIVDRFFLGGPGTRLPSPAASRQPAASHHQPPGSGEGLRV
jgi:hypothetical protein